MLLRIILLPLFLLGDFPVAMAHYKSIRKSIKHWIADGCKDVKLS